jgi:protein-tyrosine kinase
VDSIRQAVELARASGSARDDLTSNGSVNGPESNFVGSTKGQLPDVRFDLAHLEKNRIIAHSTSGSLGHYYDMLRTQILQEMDKMSWQFLAVTSPTAGCGKSVTACNLALSISRLPERSVLLVDLDLRKPMVANYLGIKGPGVLRVLEGRASLSSTIVKANVGPHQLYVLPGRTATPGASEWMASQSMGTLLQTIKREFRSSVVIFDLPPMLLGADVISILPRMDAALLVAGVGSTTVSDVKECQKHLQRTPVVRVVVNKVSESATSYGYY